MLEMPGQPTNDYRTITQNLWVIVSLKRRGFHAEEIDEKNAITLHYVIYNSGNDTIAWIRTGLHTMALT